MDKVKQTIIMRKDLNLSKGRLVTQGAHASIAFLTDLIKEYNPFLLTDSQLQLNEAQKEWIYGTITCLAIGPDYSSKIDPITKHLKLL
jgi:PTH2 family peptidyl-tRNA hydrolase